MRTGVALTFTSNVQFPDGFETLPGSVPVAECDQCRTAVRHLELAFGTGDKSSVRVADLGCLEGGYSLAFAKEGYAVTGYEVRLENYQCCELVAKEWSLPNLQFIRQDVRDTLAVADTNEWDVVFCCGLLYHLADPVVFLNELGRTTRKLLILDTHYSVNPDAKHEGMSGHWYGEGRTRWSSWHNQQSFWLAKEDLMSAVRAAGFDQITEIDDDRPDRAMFIATKIELD